MVSCAILVSLWENSMKTTVKLLNPKSVDTKYTGPEPDWRSQPDPESRTSTLTRAFGWYHYFYSKKEARDMLVAWLENQGRKSDVRQFRRVPDSAIQCTAAWLCRMHTVGLVLTEAETAKLEKMVATMLATAVKHEEPVSEETAVVPRTTIQDRLRERVSECAGEIDGMFDDFVAAGAKMSADIKPIATIRGMNVAPQMINDIAAVWKRKLSEFESVAAGTDSQLVEGYQHLSKIQLRNVIKFCEAVINDCGAYVQIKKVERKPRKAKPVSPEKRAAKFKYLTEFAELKLKSIPASQLVDKSEAWLYNTKTRKLIHLVADSHVGQFTLKSNTVIGYSTTESMQKTLRKPAEVLKEIMTGGKPAARKVYKDLKTTETAFNGRGNEHIVILKSW
jgi:hypothetical protein